MISIKWFYAMAMVLLLIILSCNERKGGKDHSSGVFEKENLMAWCIVPYDAGDRDPGERAQMLKELGITMLAYDWREEHIPSFDEEWKALQRYGIKLQAFWLVTGPDPENDRLVEEVFDFLERNNIQTQLWVYIINEEDFESADHMEKVSRVSRIITYIADRAKTIDSQVGLYNHRGWLGEPENQLEIIDNLNRKNVGIVYNFHHGVGHHQRFKDFFPMIEPHLLAVNLAGIKTSDSLSFYDVGEGDAEYEMIQIVLESNFSGPVGIINHDHNRDAREGLVTQMHGLNKVLDSVRNQSER